MRRADREITDFAEIVELVSRCDTLRIALHDEPYPYVVPVSFGYEVCGGKLAFYIHGAGEGKKLDLLARDDRVCVEADLCHRFVESGASVSCEYESVIGFGSARRVTGPEAQHALSCILAHCGFPGYPCEAGQGKLDVYRITLDAVTGKRRRG